MNKPNLLAIVPSLMPTVNIGIINPLLHLRNEKMLSFQVTFPYLFKPSMLDKINCVVFCRNSNPNEEWILKEIISRNIPYIFEIDDDFFEIPYDNLLGRNHRHPTHLVTLQNFIRNAALVRTYNPLLAENIERLNPHREINNAYFDMSLIAGIQPIKSDKIKIVYATSRMADEQQSIFNEALKKIALEFPSTVEIYFWGAPITDEELKKQNNVFNLEPIYDYVKFIQKFYAMGFDIGLAPIFGSRFFNSKTNNKYREYGGCQIAGVYSNEPLYTNCVQNEINGILVDNTPESWYEGIKKLITDQSLREKIIQTAFQDIRINYSFERFCTIWMSSIDKALNRSIPPAPPLGLYERNTTIHCCMLHDLELDNNLEIIRSKLFSDIYLHSRIKILTKRLIDKEDLYKVERFKKNYDNILVFSNDIELIDHFAAFAIKNSHKKIIIVTNAATDCRHSASNFVIINIDGYSTKVFSHYSENIYCIIDDAMKHTFTQHQIPGMLKRIRSKLIKLIKHNLVIRKILFLISKKNAIKLRLHSFLMLYKINQGIK